MKKIVCLSLCLLLPLLGGVNADAASRGRKGKKAPAEAPAPQKKTPYEKFLAKKELVRMESFFAVYKDAKDLWLEIPDSLLGRKVLMSATVARSSSPAFGHGLWCSSNPVYTVSATDSLVLFTAADPAVRAAEGEKDLNAALERSRAGATVFAFPVKYRNADSTSRIINASKLFDESKKDVFNPEGLPFGDALVYVIDKEDKLSRLKEVRSFPSGIVVTKEMTGELTLVSSMGGILSDKPSLTADIDIALTLLPEKDFRPRKADARIGTGVVPYVSYRSDAGEEKGNYAVRWDISRGLKVYVDTLLPVSWRSAVRQGIERWNTAFEAMGRGRVVEVLPYADSIDVSDPFLSIVTFCGGAGMNLTAQRLTDKSTGEILSSRIFIPGDYLTGIRRASVYRIPDVDPRFQAYDLCDEAICEVLRADVMAVFGLCLGLSRNYAAAAAYAPEQLRDPRFTAENGITSSVMSGEKFNYFARPGDKERGLKIIADDIGPYDHYALTWLYGSFPGDEKAALDRWIADHAGKPEYAYGTAPSSRGRTLMSCQLGNDVFAAYEAGLSHLKYVAEHGADWIDDSVPESYAQLFYDWLFLRYNDLTAMVASRVGYFRMNDARDPVKAETLPAAVQKKALKTYFDGWRDLAWMESKPLLHIAGTNANASYLGMTSFFSLLGSGSKLASVAMARDVAGGDYTPQAFLTDLQEEVLRNVRRGHLMPKEEQMVRQYLEMLISHSPLMKENLQKRPSREAFADFTVGTASVPAAYAEELEVLCRMSLKRASALLQAGASACGNDYDRRKILYLKNIAQAALGKE